MELRAGPKSMLGSKVRMFDGLERTDAKNLILESLEAGRLGIDLREGKARWLDGSFRHHIRLRRVSYVFWTSTVGCKTPTSPSLKEQTNSEIRAQ